MIVKNWSICSMFFNVHIPPQGYGEHIKNLWLQNNQWVSDVRSDQKILKIFSLVSISTIEDDAFDDLHSLQWLKLWNNDLQTLHYELMEPVLDTLIHLDIHSERSSQNWSWETFIILQATHWCVTVRWGGTRGGITMDGRFVFVCFFALQQMVNVQEIKLMFWKI